MRKLVVFDSGSTKTNAIISDLSIQQTNKNKKNKTLKIQLSGFNPNRENTDFLKELKKMDISENDAVFFYGSGLAAKENKLNLKKIFLSYFNNNTFVFDDILGSARALFGNEKGNLAILGTGGLAATYNGEIITKRTGGYGYLIDDLGGGYELGKLIIAQWLNNNLPPNIDHELSAFLQINKLNFIKEYYSNPLLSYHKEGLLKIATVTKFIAKHKNNEQVKLLIKNYFELFFRRNVLFVCTNNKKLKLCGSIANEFEEIIKEASEQFNIEITEIIKFPIQKLFEYHYTKLVPN